MTAEERAQRERLREGAGGITAYATDANTTVVAFAVGGTAVRRWTAVRAGPPRSTSRDRCSTHVPTRRRGASPTSAGRHCASVSSTAVRGCSPATAPTTGRTVSWGSADFVAAEEMGRYRGYWWSPDGESIAACRVDEAPVAEWVIADPADAERTPARTIRYPAAGTDNAIVTLHVLGLDGTPRRRRLGPRVLPLRRHRRLDRRRAAHVGRRRATSAAR